MMLPRKPGFFSGRDLPAAESFEGFCRAATMRDQPDLHFVHGQESNGSAPAKGLVQGVTWFGPGKSVAEPVFAVGKARMTDVESVSLREAAFLPRRATVFVPERGAYLPSVAGFLVEGRGLQALAAADPSYAVGEDGSLSVRAFDRLEYQDGIGIPVCGVGFPNYGHFLFDGLPLAWLMAEQLRRQNACLIGGPLGRWQDEVLRTLGVADIYRPLTQPSRFRRLVTSNLVFGHVPYPTRFARLPFDTIRARVGAPSGPRDRRILLVRPNNSGRRHLINAAEVADSLAHLGFEVVQPERLTFREQVRLFAAASVVVGESGAAMANIGFCDPGTRVLEIMPEVHVEGWTRGTCLVFSHEWHVYFASVVEPPPGSAEGEARMQFSYRVDVASLREAVRVICGVGDPVPKSSRKAIEPPATSREDTIAQLEAGVQHAREGRHREAREILARVGESPSFDVTISHKIGVILKYCREYEEALSHFHRALQMQPSFHFSKVEIGSIHAELGRAEEALSWYRKAIDSAPEYVLPYILAARIEQQLGRNHLGVALLERACALAPRNREVQVTLAQFLVYQNRRDDAIEVYERAVSNGLAQEQDYISYLTLLNDTGAYDKLAACCAALSPRPESALRQHLTRLLAHAKLAKQFGREAFISAAVARESGTRWSSPTAVSAAVRDAIVHRRPFSMIRLGDGEARFLVCALDSLRKNLSPEEAFATGDSIWRNWFGESMAHVDRSDLESLRVALTQSILNADILGVPTADRLRRDFAHFGYLAALIDTISESIEDGASCSLTDAAINIELHRASPFYRAIVAGLDFVGVISPHPDLAARLGRELCIAQVASYVIPGEMRLPERPGLTRGNGHFPNRYKQLLAELAVPYPGAVFLVAGGLLGKVYCAQIKRRGGIAIDVGAVADAWAGYATRPGQYEPSREWRLP
jgi:capsular polysaccharide biosynthesis protein